MTPLATEPPPRSRRPILLAARWFLAGALLTAAGLELAHRRHELADALRLFAHLRWWAVGLAVAAEVTSLVAFAQLQRGLLEAGAFRVGLGRMLALVTAGNALGTSLPGGAAWSAGWEWNQLRRRGAPRPTVVWVLLMAGALSSFALFVVIAVGIAVAGSTGPFAPTRWVVASLAAIPVGAVLLGIVVRAVPGVRSAWHRLAARLEGAVPPARHLSRAYRAVVRIRPRPRDWLALGGLALLNWVENAACLLAAILALGGTVPWRGLLVSYGFAQVAATIPITPGGLGVVEGSLAALLVAYGVQTDRALADVGLYRLISFWAPAAVGWTIWAVTVLGERRGPGSDQGERSSGSEPAPAGRAVRP